MSAPGIARARLLGLPGHAERARPEMSIRAWLEANGRTRNHAPAISGLSGRRPLDHASLAALVRRIGGELLDAGIGRGDVVLMCMPNGPEALAALLSVASVAAAFPVAVDEPLASLEQLADIIPIRAVLFNPEHGSAAAELAKRRQLQALPIGIDRAGASGLFALPPLRAAELRAQPVDVDDACFVVKTAGTTHAPKIVAWSQASLAWSTDEAAAWMALTPDDHSLCVMPLSHLHAIIRSTVPVLRRGGRVTCCPGFDSAQILEWIDQYQPTFMTAVPGVYRTMITRAQESGARPGGALRLLVTGSDAIDETTLAQLSVVFGVPVQEFYGQSEATPFLAVSEPGAPPRRAGAIGFPVAPWMLRCFGDDGAPLAPGIEGAIGAKGGMANPVVAGGDNKTFGDGWYPTGDRGWVDAQGALHLSGRVDDRINRGGKKIAPETVEAVLASHRGVCEALVFPVPDAVLGERVAALVVAASLADFDELALRAFARRHLDAAMVPDRIVAVPELPISATGKKVRKGIAPRFMHEIEAQRAARTLPDSDAERTLATIVSELTLRADIDLDAPITSLGLDSFASLNLLLAIDERMGVAIDPADLLACASLAVLADFLAAGARPGSPMPAQPAADGSIEIVRLRDGDIGPPLMVVHAYLGASAYFLGAAAHMTSGRAVLGLDWMPAHVGATASTLQAHAAKCVAALRAAQPKGPYALVGYSFAAHLAFEIAQQLFASGEHVAFLGILDDEADLHKRWFGIEARPQVEPSIRAHCVHMLHGYVPHTYPGDVCLFQARVRPPSHLADPLQGWGDIVSGEVRRVDVPGDHSSFLADSAAALWMRDLERELTSALQGAQLELAQPVFREARMAAAGQHSGQPWVRAARRAREAGKTGALDEEIAAYETALEASPAQAPWWVYRNIGEALAASGQPERALDAFLAGASRERMPAEAMARAARHLQTMKRYPQANALLARARALSFDDEPHAHFAMSDLALLAGDDAAAEAHLRRSWELTPSTIMWWRLADLLARRGRIAEAMLHVPEIRRRWPRDEELMAHIAAMEQRLRPDLHLIVDGQRIDAASHRDTTWRFELPSTARSVSIVSRRCVPAETHQGASDMRMLGVALAKLVIDSPRGRIEIAYDEPSLREGFHEAEARHRWTDGCALLPPALVAELGVDSALEICLGTVQLQYERYAPE